MVAAKQISTFFIVLLSISLMGQSIPKVSLNFSNAPLGKVLDYIEQETKMTFSYPSDLVNKSNLVSINVSNQKVNKAVEKVLDKNIRAIIVGDHLVLATKPKEVKTSKVEQKQRKAFLTGTIQNGRNGNQISKASIYNFATQDAFFSNEKGRFKIPNTINESFSITIAKKGFHNTIIQINPNQDDSIRVILKPETKPVEKLTLKKNPGLEKDPVIISKLVNDDDLQMTENLKLLNEVRVGQLSFVPIIGTNGLSSGIFDNNLSVNTIGGYNGGVKGAEVGGGFNIITRNVFGVQAAGFLNLVKGTVNGVQVAGGINFTLDSIYGVQAAGFFNLGNSHITGAQLSGAINICRHKITGAQVSGFYNHSKDLHGAQAAGFYNQARNLKGAQASGFVNLALNDLTGVQASGAINFTGGHTKGAQIAGIFNHSKKLEGVQISGIINTVQHNSEGVQISLINRAGQNNGLQVGLINLSDSAKGLAIGLINFVKNGYKAFSISSNELLFANVSFRSGSKHFYTIYNLGGGHRKYELASVGIGLGSMFTIKNRFNLAGEISSNMLHIVNQEEFTFRNWTRFSINLGYTLFDRFNFYVGPSYNILVTDKNDKLSDPFGDNIAPITYYDKIQEDERIEMWTGIELGVIFKL
jgi:uncharacterized protein YjbI with pentapeptide repeats